MDAEWTAWEGSRGRQWQGPGEEKEIVQIGAIRLQNDEDLSEIVSLDFMVIPIINPELSDYFTNLTGITQGRMESDSLDFADGLAALGAFLGDETKVYSYGDDATVIRRDCQRRGLNFPLTGWCS